MASGVSRGKSVRASASKSASGGEAPDASLSSKQLMKPSGLTKPPSIFVGLNESLDHLGRDEVAAELIELTQPEVVAREVRVVRVVRVPSQSITFSAHRSSFSVAFILHPSAFILPT
jgi:hypothetical protein